MVLAALLAPGVAWFNILVVAIRYAGQPNTVSVFPHILFLLLLLIVGGNLAGGLRPAWRLAPRERLATYFLKLMVAVMSSHDLIEVLVPILSYPHRYATPASKWTVQITPHLPNWLVVSNPQAVERCWIGGSDFWRSGDWR